MTPPLYYNFFHCEKKESQNEVRDLKIEILVTASLHSFSILTELGIFGVKKKITKSNNKVSVLKIKKKSRKVKRTRKSKIYEVRKETESHKGTQQHTNNKKKKKKIIKKWLHS